MCCQLVAGRLVKNLEAHENVRAGLIHLVLVKVLPSKL